MYIKCLKTLSEKKKPIEDELGEKIDDDIKIKIIAKKPKELVLVIPEIENANKIPDEILIETAGGGSFTSSLIHA